MCKYAGSLISNRKATKTRLIEAQLLRPPYRVHKSVTFVTARDFFLFFLLLLLVVFCASNDLVKLSPQFSHTSAGISNNVSVNMKGWKSPSPSSLKLRTFRRVASFTFSSSSSSSSAAVSAKGGGTVQAPVDLRGCLTSGISRQRSPLTGFIRSKSALFEARRQQFSIPLA